MTERTDTKVIHSEAGGKKTYMLTGNLEDLNVAQQLFAQVIQLSLVMRKPVFGVCDEVRLKQACSTTEASQGLKILAITSRGIILSKQRTTKALIRLHGCTG